MTRLDEILLQLQKIAREKCMDLEEESYNYDRRKTGFLTINQFESLLASVGLRLMPNEHKIVADAFITPQRMIDYRKFVSAVKAAKSQQPQRADVSHELLQLHKKLAEKNVTFREVVHLYDRLNRGYISENDFLQAFYPSTYAVPIARAYSNNGMIQISEVDDAINALLTRKPPPQKIKPDSVDKIAKQINHRQIDYWFVFSSRDRFNSGKIDPPIFINVLTSTGITYTPQEAKELIEYYRVDDQVNYAAFINDVRRVANEEREMLEKSRPPIPEPDYEDITNHIKTICQKRKVQLSDFFQNLPPQVTRYQFIHSLLNARLGLTQLEIEFLADHCTLESGLLQPSLLTRNVDTPKMENTALADADKAIAKIKDFLQQKELILTPRLMKFDREQSGEFPVSLINSVVSQFGLHLTEYELDTLQYKFPGHSIPFVRWKELDAEIEPDPSLFKIKFDTGNENAEPYQPPEKQIPNHILELLKELGDNIRRSQINLYDELRFADKTKSGFLVPYQVNSILLRFFPKLTRVSLDTLMQEYGKSQFKYREFCNDIERASKMEPTKSKKIQEVAEDPDYIAFIRRLKAFSVKRLIQPLEIFTTRDTARIGFVLVAQANNCFSEVGFHVTPHEMDILIRKFRDPKFPERFLYIPLVKDVEKEKMTGEEAKWILTPELAVNQIHDNASKAVCGIHAKMVARKKYMQNFFNDAPKGPISVYNFTQRMNKTGIIIEPVDFQIILKYYKDDNGVNWEKFVEDVDEARLL